MNKIFELDKKAMDIAINIMICERHEENSELKEFKLKKLKKELELLKKEINSIMIKNEAEKNSIGKELLKGLFE